MRCRALVERKGGSPPRAKQSPAGALFALLTVSTEPPCSSPPGRWNIKKQLLQMQPERGALVERREGSPPRAKQSPAGALFALLTVSTEPPCSSPTGHWNIKKQLLQMQPERGALVERREGSPPRAKQSPAGALFALLTVSTEPPCSSPTGHWNKKTAVANATAVFGGVPSGTRTHGLQIHNLAR